MSNGMVVWAISKKGPEGNSWCQKTLIRYGGELTGGFIVVHTDPFQLQIRVPDIVPTGVYPMLITDHFPELRKEQEIRKKQDTWFRYLQQIRIGIGALIENLFCCYTLKKHSKFFLFCPPFAKKFNWQSFPHKTQKILPNQPSQGPLS